MRKIIEITIGVTIAIITLAAVFMPILSEATTTEDTFTNTGYYRMSDVTGTTDDYVITWDYTDPRIVNVNGDPYEIPADALVFNSSKSIVMSEKFIVRLINSGGSNYLMQVWVNGYNAGASVNAQTSATITISSDSMVFVITDGSPATYTYEEYILAVDPNGEYIMKSQNETAYLKKDSPIYAGGISTVGTGVNYTMFINGTVDDINVYSNGSGVTISNEQVNYTDVSDHIDLVKFTSVTFDTTYNSNVVSQTYSYLCVPYEVTAERAVHLDLASIGVLAAIPIIIIVAILMLAVSIIARNRD